MYKNLVEILKRKGITNKAYADYLGQITGENRVHTGRSTENVCVNAGV